MAMGRSRGPRKRTEVVAENHALEAKDIEAKRGKTLKALGRRHKSYSRTPVAKESTGPCAVEGLGRELCPGVNGERLKKKKKKKNRAPLGSSFSYYELVAIC